MHDARRRRKIVYVRCTCGFKHENTQNCNSHIHAGDYCPKCGEQLDEYNELTRQHSRPVGLFG